jgi:hypothetical protein
VLAATLFFYVVEFLVYNSTVGATEIGFISTMIHDMSQAIPAPYRELENKSSLNFYVFFIQRDFCSRFTFNVMFICVTADLTFETR